MIAGQHLRELLEAKKRQAGQTPAWKLIEHHDHAPRTENNVPHTRPRPDLMRTRDSGEED